MKKCCVFLVLLMLLSGCGVQETFETVADTAQVPVMAPAAQVSVSLPAAVSEPATQSENGALYFCDGYEIAIQTMDAGDLDRTIHSLSGFERSALEVYTLGRGEIWEYRFAWTCVGEDGQLIGRATILDDGNYHYCLTILGDADRADSFVDTWQSLMASFRLV